MQNNKFSRRSFLRGSAVAGIGLALVACAPAAAPAGGAQTGGESSEASAPATEQVVIRWMSRAGPDNDPNAQRVLDEDFTSQTGIKVQLEPVPEDFVQKLLAQMIAGTAPDIFEAWGNIFFNWTERDLLLDVQPFVDRDLTEEQISDYNDFQWEGLLMLGKRVGMPKYINVMTVTVNVDKFEEYGVELPPENGEWNHDDYADMARRLTEAARAAGEEAFWGGWKPAWSWDRFWNTVYMFGGQIVNEKYGTQCMMGTPEAQAGFQWMYDMIWTHNWFGQPGQLENRWGDDALSPGFVGFIEDGTYPIGRDRRLGEEGAGIRWDMRHVPTGPTGIRKVLGTTDAWSATKGTQHPEEAWKVLQFMSGPVYQDKQIVAQEGLIPVLKSRIANFIDTVRAVRPSLENVRLETIKELLDWGYAEDSFWFKNQNAAFEIINPALEKVYTVGDVGPEYFIEICEQVDASQQG
jgi:multiple sugar transport system substrate-binding protein